MLELMKSPIKRHLPVGFCIYCGTTQGKLTKEHVIPEGLGGTVILPESSCKACEKITSQFERSVARFIYGNYRIKQEYPSKRKKQKKRPTELPVYTIDNKETEQKINVPIRDYPITYIAVELPPPGLLLGIAPSNLNPELKFNLKGDAASLNQTMDALTIERLIIKHGFDWAAFFKQLAKIGHCYAFCCLRRRGYEPLLPDIIFGKSQHLSHYVGGISRVPESEEISTSDLYLSLVENDSEYYLVVGIQLLGMGTLPRYQVVAGHVSDLHAFYTALAESKKAV